MNLREVRFATKTLRRKESQSMTPRHAQRLPVGMTLRDHEPDIFPMKTVSDVTKIKKCLKTEMPGESYEVMKKYTFKKN